MEKKINRITKLQIRKSGPGFRSIDMTHSEFNIEPFLIFAEFYMDRQVFGPHPHAGISVMTYVLPDSQAAFINRDSRGDYTVIEPGGLHVTQAGKGIQHDELPAVDGVDSHAFQIWINHSEQDRFVEPKAFHATPKQIPEWITEKVLLRVLQGRYHNLKSPIELVTKTSLFDITLKPNALIDLDANEMMFIYVMSGEIIVGDKKAVGPVIINFESEGENITVSTNSQSANFMFASGVPHNEPIIYGGPFVMTTEKQMQETQASLQRGEMGILNPV